MNRLLRNDPADADAEADRLRRHAEGLERLIRADVGSRPSLGDRIDEILEIGLEHLGLELAEVGRLTPSGFSGWHTAGNTAATPDLAGRRTDAARAATAAGGSATSAPREPAPAFAAATLPDLGADAAVVFVGKPRSNGFDALDIGFLRLLAQILSGAMARHRARQDLADARDELAMILENVPAYVTSVDAEGHIHSANEAARRVRRPEASTLRDADCIARGEPRFGDLERWTRRKRPPISGCGRTAFLTRRQGQAARGSWWSPRT